MLPERAIARRAIPLPTNPINRKNLRRANRSESDPHKMNAGTDARLAAAALMPTAKSVPPRAAANSGIKADVAPPAAPCVRDEEHQGHPAAGPIPSRRP